MAPASQKGATAATTAEPAVVVARVDPAPTPPSSSPRVIGNKRSLVYHVPGCPGFSGLKYDVRAEFSSVQEAEQAGYRRADNCPESAAASVAVMANSRTHTYALPHCPGYTGTREEYRVTFNSVAEAEQAGYKRGDKCR
jgi:methylphosphotriester-DNA--protein-cysteine methyltransferase